MVARREPTIAPVVGLDPHLVSWEGVESPEWKDGDWR